MSAIWDMEGFGLMDYRYRFLSTRLGRFTQPDSIVPDMSNPQSLNRYAYVNNNPVMFVDPTGHIACEVLGTEACDENGDYTYEDVSGPTANPENTLNYLINNAIGNMKEGEEDKR